MARTVAPFFYKRKPPPPLSPKAPTISASSSEVSSSGHDGASSNSNSLSNSLSSKSLSSKSLSAGDSSKDLLAEHRRHHSGSNSSAALSLGGFHRMLSPGMIARHDCST